MPSYNIYSGGARGIDSFAESYAIRHGHTCHVFIPSCDKRAKYITPIPKHELDSAFPRVIEAGHHLSNVSSNPVTQQYLCRNWFIVKDAHQCLAFGYLDDVNKNVQGGTGWTVDMAKTREIDTWVFDLNFETWFKWNAKTKCFEESQIPPVLRDHTAIVGSRDVTGGGLIELETLFFVDAKATSMSVP